jgi:uncharacterized protein (DUF1015 family)
MVKISPLQPYIPADPSEFCTRPYDVIEPDEEQALKKNPRSLVHLILPDGEGDAKYEHAAQIYQQFKDSGTITRVDTPSIFVYRQGSPEFMQEGFIVGLSLDDYDCGCIIRHERTREKPLQDRVKIYEATRVVPGLVWTFYRANPRIKDVLDAITRHEPLFSFPKYGYENTLWRESDPEVISDLQALLATEYVYIADGHHRCAAAAEFRERRLAELGDDAAWDAPWQSVMAYVAPDDAVRILPYNRVIRRLPMDDAEFIEKIGEIFTVTQDAGAFFPGKKHEFAMCLRGTWYCLVYEDEEPTPLQDLDVSILQERVLGPVLGIEDPRSDENLFFVGGVTDLEALEANVTTCGNDMLFLLYPVQVQDLEQIADGKDVMPPKSTWFDPKLLSGLTLNELS